MHLAIPAELGDCKRVHKEKMQLQQCEFVSFLSLSLCFGLGIRDYLRSKICLPSFPRLVGKLSCEWAIRSSLLPAFPTHQDGQTEQMLEQHHRSASKQGIHVIVTGEAAVWWYLCFALKK